MLTREYKRLLLTAIIQVVQLGKASQELAAGDLEDNYSLINDACFNFCAEMHRIEPDSTPDVVTLNAQ